MFLRSLCLYNNSMWLLLKLKIARMFESCEHERRRIDKSILYAKSSLVSPFSVPFNLFCLLFVHFHRGDGILRSLAASLCWFRSQQFHGILFFTQMMPSSIASQHPTRGSFHCCFDVFKRLPCADNDSNPQNNKQCKQEKRYVNSCSQIQRHDFHSSKTWLLARSQSQFIAWLCA